MQGGPAHAAMASDGNYRSGGDDSVWHTKLGSDEQPSTGGTYGSGGDDHSMGSGDVMASDEQPSTSGKYGSGGDDFGWHTVVGSDEQPSTGGKYWSGADDSGWQAKVLSTESMGSKRWSGGDDSGWHAMLGSDEQPSQGSMYWRGGDDSGWHEMVVSDEQPSKLAKHESGGDHLPPLPKAMPRPPKAAQVRDEVAIAPPWAKRCNFCGFWTYIGKHWCLREACRQKGQRKQVGVEPPQDEQWGVASSSSADWHLGSWPK